ncbi:MAG: hypothetical protein ABSE84_28790 [Isosphaeraceae bacterium]
MTHDSRENRLVELLLCWKELREQGRCVTPHELSGDCPELADELKRQIETLRAMDFLLKPMAAVRRGGSSSASPPTPVP